MTAHNYRDVVIEQLADENASLRDACEYWRAMALAVMERLTTQAREIAMINERSYVCRRHIQDQRDVFRDQTT